jgi:hypothetical protein
MLRFGFADRCWSTWNLMEPVRASKTAVNKLGVELN